MSLLISRQPAEKLIPALQGLQKWRRCYDEIVRKLQQAHTKKGEETNITVQNISQFISKSQQIVKNFIDEVDKSLENQQDQLDFKTEKIKRRGRKIMSEGKSQIQTMFKTPQRSKTIQKKGENGTKSHLLKSRIKNEENFSSFQIKQLKKLINQKRKVRQYVGEIEANKFLSRNPQICQIYIRKLHAEKESLYWKGFEQNFKLQYCSQCDLLVPSSKNFTLIRNHYNREHNRKADKKQCQIFQVKQVFDKLKSRIDSGQLVYYKCNCKIRSFKSKQQYIEHVISKHNGNPPPFSSHFFMSQNPQDLFVNPYFDQYCILEQMIIPQVFYCGICDIMFGPTSQVYFEHISKSHQQEDLKNSLSSHFIKSKSGQSKRTTMADLYKDIHKNAKNKQERELYHQKMKEQGIRSRNRSKAQLRNRSKSPLHISKNKNHPKNRQRFNIPILYDRTTDSGQLFEDEIKMIEVIGNYGGPYICGYCLLDCRSYKKLAEHTSSQRLAHLRCQNKWTRVCIFKVEQKKRVDYLLPTNPSAEYLEYTFNVPITSDPTRVMQYRRMKYGEFLEYVRLNGVNGNTSYNWLHLKTQTQQ